MTRYERFGSRSDYRPGHLTVTDRGEETSYAINQWHSYREISDCYRKRRVGGRFPASPVLHRSVELRDVDFSAWGEYWRAHYWTSYSTQFIPWSPTSFLGYAESHLSRSYEDLAQRAFDKFSDQVPEELSLGNFFLEFKEAWLLIPNLIDSIAKAAQGKAPRSITGDAASAHLWSQFGLLPLIGDLEKLAGLVKAVEKRLEWIRSHNGKTTRVTYKRTDLYAGIPEITPRVGLDHGLEAYLTQVGAVFRAHCDLQVELEDVDGMIGFTRAMISALGLNNPLGIIYNATPFSFLLDWVIRFGDMLARRKIQPFVGVWFVDDFGWSLTSSSLWTVIRHVAFEPWNIRMERKGFIYERTYRREPGLPVNELEGLLTFPPTAGQAALLLALARGSFR